MAKFGRKFEEFPATQRRADFDSPSQFSFDWNSWRFWFLQSLECSYFLILERFLLIPGMIVWTTCPPAHQSSYSRIVNGGQWIESIWRKLVKIYEHLNIVITKEGVRSTFTSRKSEETLVFEVNIRVWLWLAKQYVEKSCLKIER